MRGDSFFFFADLWAIIAGWWLKEVSNMTGLFSIYGIIPTPLTFFKMVKTANQIKNAFEQSEQNLIHDDSWFTQIRYLCWCFDKTSLFQGFLRKPNWNLGMVIGLTMLSTWFFWTLWSSHSCGWFESEGCNPGAQVGTLDHVDLLPHPTRRRRLRSLRSLGP